MRYRTRWSNGFWKAFDSVRFKDTAVFFTKADADKSVARLNGGAK